MENILYFISGIALGSYLSRSWTTKGFKTLKKKIKSKNKKKVSKVRVATISTKPKTASKTAPTISRRIIQKDKNKDKVLKIFQENKKVTNDDIEKILKVSDYTAERYLNELEEKGKVAQHGKTGRGVFYTLK